MNDYYLNLLDWGYNNIIAVALNQSVYLWHADNGRIDHLTELDSDQYVSSVQWSFQDNSLAIGTSNNTVQLWNADRLEMTREMRGHSARVSSLSWKDGNILSSGGRDSLIINHDIRERRSKISTYACHEQEVCGLAWSHDGSTLVKYIQQCFRIIIEVLLPLGFRW